MIRRLRRKFVLTNMALVSVVLAAVCAFWMYSTVNQQQSATRAALYRVMSESSGIQKPEIIKRDALGPGDKREEGGAFSSTAAFWVVADADGNILEKDVETVDISDETLAAITAEVLAAGQEQGVLSDPSLRYLTQKTPTGTKVAFAVRSGETAAIQAMLLRLAVMVSGALLAFLGISVFLARMAVRPVAEAWEQQRQFVADASHELKTPLTVILANASILRAHPEQTVAEGQKWLSGIEDEGARMKKLIDDLLFLARADAGRTPVEFGRVDLTDTVWSGALAFESVAFEKGVRLDADAAPGLWVLGSAGQLKQLTAILVDNACKYAGGNKEVQVRLRAVGANAVLQVENTGEDIPQKELPHIFERFYRTDPSRARTAGGYGLGLAIAKTIAESHHGSIRAESGGGRTVFTVTLPLEK